MHADDEEQPLARDGPASPCRPEGRGGFGRWAPTVGPLGPTNGRLAVG